MVSTVTNTKFLMGVATGIALLYLWFNVIPKMRGQAG